MSELARPVPVPDSRTAPFWLSAGRHVLSLALCARCSTFSHPPDVVCPNCLSNEPGFEFIPVDGRGTIRSWTVMRQSFLPGFAGDVPFVLVDVELTEHPHVRLIGRLLDGPDAQFGMGSPVRVAFEDLAPGFAVPAFSLRVEA